MTKTASWGRLREACRLVGDAAARGELVLFVHSGADTDDLKRRTRRIGMPCVTGKWTPGTLTNHATLRQGIDRLAEIEGWERNGAIRRYSLKEQAALRREKRGLEKSVEGLRAMTRLPATVVVVRPAERSIPLAEARKVRARTVALVDSNAPRVEADALVVVDDDSLGPAVTRLVDVVAIAVPKARKRRRPGDDDEGTARVAARLRPKPSPKRGGARPSG